MKACFTFKTTLGTLLNRNIQTTLGLLDSLVKPIFLCCSDFGGCIKPPKDNPIEKFHQTILGVQKQTTNIRVLLELGRIPLQIYSGKVGIKNWERIKLG